jgi:putative tryptophan/tyrosine transport system substrate-binding protein
MRLIGLAAVLTVIVAFAPLAVEAQPAGRTVTIGYLGNSSPSHESHLVEALREGLRQLGYVEGRNLTIKYAWAEGRPDRFPVLARELVDLKPDVILTSGTPGALAAKRATRSIPIVMAVVGNPLEVGLVSSLAKPGGNATGLSALGAELEGKRLEFLTQIFPKLSRAAVLLNPDNPFTAIAWKSLQPAAESVGVMLQRFEVRGPNDLDQVLAAIRAIRPQALMVTPDRLLLTYREPIVQFVTKNRLPGIFPYREFAEEGGLMTYGPDYVDMFRRAATYVDKIIKGAKPADLPVEQPTKFELVINLKTAKALGLTVPQTLLQRADQIIE